MKKSVIAGCVAFSIINIGFSDTQLNGVSQEADKLLSTLDSDQVEQFKSVVEKADLDENAISQPNDVDKCITKVSSANATSYRLKIRLRNGLDLSYRDKYVIDSAMITAHILQDNKKLYCTFVPSYTNLVASSVIQVGKEYI